MNATSGRTRFAILGIVSLALFLLQGCAAPPRRDAVPAALQTRAEIPGLPGIRYIPVIPEDVKAMAQEGMAAFLRERAYLESHGLHGPLPPAVYLAISGGGDNGAFGAGLLNGWTVSGTRPTFKLVTGVSTGALIAPFAFLGPAYDGKLREVYTQVSPRDILEMRSLLAAIFGDALADNKPLWRLLEKHVDQRMLDAIAAEYAKGRLLLVATTNLDSRLPVVWNLTKIAASGHPRALELFRTLMIASAAIPGAFPPVLIDVVADGRSYQEMHVDGGATAQLFVYPPSLHVKQLLREHHVQRERKLYIIRNARLDPEWAQVERRTLPIAQRAISSLIQSQGVGDLYRIYLTAQQDQMDYNLAYIPKSFQAPHREDFDTTYMRALFDLGYRLAQKGYPWQKAPPGV
ncbi:MAG TPA: patatin-like phospholipase family protein [Methylococcus sp.]|nr:patatin-like phospholipase family protein [Methylococcus sp.]